jgi:hypothetical protein
LTVHIDDVLCDIPDARAELNLIGEDLETAETVENAADLVANLDAALAGLVKLQTELQRIRARAAKVKP